MSAKTLYCRGKVDVSVRIRIKKRSNFLELSIYQIGYNSTSLLRISLWKEIYLKIKGSEINGWMAEEKFCSQEHSVDHVDIVIG